MSSLILKCFLFMHFAILDLIEEFSVVPADPYILSHVIGPVVCNWLPFSVHHAQTLLSFKSPLKSHLFSIYTHSHACMHARMHACTRVHTHTHTHMHTLTHIGMHAHTHTHTHTLTHTQTQTHMHSHAHTQLTLHTDLLKACSRRQLESLEAGDREKTSIKL